jgi:hypothetical protein
MLRKKSPCKLSMLINKQINNIVITILETWFSNDGLHLHLKPSDNHAIINGICGFKGGQILVHILLSFDKIC